jgi:hypothetical protein
MADYAADLLSQATQAYPFVAKHNPMVVVNPMEGKGFAQTYPIGETGKPLEGGGYSKHSSLPINRVGVEIYKPDEFSHHALAGEMLHIDPMANKTRKALMQSWTPKQLNTLKEHALDYQATLDEGRPEADAIKNATDAALRGYTIKQWPDEVNQELAYSPKQLKVLESLKSYMTQPPSRKSIIEQQINQLPQE